MASTPQANANYWKAVSKLDQLVSLSEFAASNYIHPETVRRWILQGKLIALKSGGRWYVLSDFKTE